MKVRQPKNHTERSVIAMPKVSAILILTVCLFACASAIPIQVPGIQVADEAHVAGCTYLDNVHGASGLYGMFASKGLENARFEALRQAKDIGATHVVWVPTAQGHGSSQASARAYRCTSEGGRK
jgi:hypothetical protein